MASLPNVLVTAPAKGIKTLQDLVATARAKPGAMNYAALGPGTASHLNAERFRLSAGFEAQHVPFKGSPEAITEILTGRVDFLFSTMLISLPLIRDGKILPLAVSSTRRAADLPDVPTTVEAGFPNSEYIFWFGLLLPAKTPPALAERLNRELETALAMPSVRTRLAAVGAEPMHMKQDAFAAFMRREFAATADVIKAAGIKPN